MIVKRGKRNAISRLLRAGNEREMVATWRSDIDRILHVFNVRSIVSVWVLLTLRPRQSL